jgi:hypothetical protein
MAESTINDAQKGRTDTSRSDHVLAQLWNALSAFLLIEHYDKGDEYGYARRAGDNAEPRPGTRVWY